MKHLHFIEIWGTWMTYYLFDSLLTFVNRFIFASEQTLFNYLMFLENLHSVPYTGPVLCNVHC